MTRWPVLFVVLSFCILPKPVAGREGGGLFV
jgi:hypothetical protein